MTSSNELSLSVAARQSLLDHANAGAPAEVCGVLVGEYESFTVEAIRRVENVAADPERRYELAPEAVVATIDRVGVDRVVGFYHSHPRGPAGPSDTDRAQATWAGYVYLIVSLGGETPDIGAWEWTGDDFRPLSVGVA